MEVIHLTYPHTYQKTDFPKQVLALGYFDGLHLGHMQVLETAKKIAIDESITFAVMIFTPHPSQILTPDAQQVRLLTPMEEKQSLLAKLGVEKLFVVTFNQAFARLSPATFVEQYLIELHAVQVVAGYDYSYGHLGVGTMSDMPYYAKQQFQITTVKEWQLDREKVSSTRIRAALSIGDCQEVNRLLGRTYRIRGSVRHGEKRGRQLGFPTANIQLSTAFDLPAIGVYAVRAKVKDRWYNGICNVGYRPTFHQNQTEEPTIEVHLFKFDETIYGENIILEWYHRIRSEKRFDSRTALSNQIAEDKQIAIDFFKGKVVF